MLLEYGAEILGICKACHVADFIYGDSVFQQFGGFLQSENPDEFLRPFARQRFQFAEKEGAAHSHFAAETVDVEFGVSQVLCYYVGYFVYCNPQNEACNATRTKGAKIKTKRALQIKRNVPQAPLLST